MKLYQWILLVGFAGALVLVTYCLCVAAKWGDEEMERWRQEERLREQGETHRHEDAKEWEERL